MGKVDIRDAAEKPVPILNIRFRGTYIQTGPKARCHTPLKKTCNVDLAAANVECVKMRIDFASGEAYLVFGHSVEKLLPRRRAGQWEDTSCTFLAQHADIRYLCRVSRSSCANTPEWWNR